MNISLKAKEILDSNRKPTVAVELRTDFGRFSASAPSGISTGKYEAKTVPVAQAVENIEKIIAPSIKNEDLADQKKIDEILKGLNAGANAVLPVSMAVCRAAAKLKNIPLYRYLSELGEDGPPSKLPKPSFNLIEGGKHAAGGLAFQEFMIIPQKNKFSDNFKIGKQIYASLGKILEKKFGKENIALSREGAFSIPIKKVFEALDLIKEALSGVSDVKIAIDAAASEFYQDGNYGVDGQVFSAKELANFYSNLIKKYPIIIIEDPFSQDDDDAWRLLKSPIIFGDDLTVTNIVRIKMAKEKKLCNGVVIKPNQIGTVTETLEAVKLAKSFNWKIMVANRAGETMDDFIADLAVGIGADYIKSGAPFPKERMAKYNRLLAIEKELK